MSRGSPLVRRLLSAVCIRAEVYLRRRVFLLVLTLTAFMTVPQSRAETAFGISFGSPYRLGAKLIAHPKDGPWGGQILGASNGTGLDAVTFFRGDARYALSRDDLRLFAFGGLAYFDGKITSRLAGTAISIEAGGGVEVRWLPGAGFSLEVGPQFTVSGDAAVSAVNFLVDFSIVVWTGFW